MSNQLQENLNLILEEKNTKLLPENLKVGITCLGVTGELKEGVDTSDATATHDDIISGKTAYVNGERVEGTILDIREGLSVGFQYENVVNIGPENGLYITSVHPDDVTFAIRKNAQVTTYLPYTDTANIIGLTGDKIVAGNTILGIEGTAEIGIEDTNAGVKLFTSVDEMEADSSLQDGDLALVYGLGQVSVRADIEFDHVYFPYEVTFTEDELPTSDDGATFRSVNGDGRIDFHYMVMEHDYGDEIEKDYNVNISIEDGGNYDWISYYFSDNKFTRSGGSFPSNNDTLLNFIETYKASNEAMNADFEVPAFVQKFMSVDVMHIYGIYQKQSDEYEVVSAQLNTTEQDIYAGKIGYGPNGVVTGTLGTNANETFNDANAELYAMIQKSYDDIPTLTITDANKSTVKTKYKTSLFIPSKSDGTSILKLDPSTTTLSELFRSCGKLKTVDLHDFDTSSITSLNGTFRDCYRLESSNLSSWNTSNVTDMTSLFFDCAKLEKVDVSHFDTAKVTSMNCMFYGCRVLGSLDLSSWNTSQLTNTGWMFMNCYALKTLDLNNFDMSNVTTMNRMFDYCTGLETLNVKDWDTTSVTNMEETFSQCNKLTTLDLSGWHTPNVTNMERLFFACRNLEVLDISNFTFDNVTNSSSMFHTVPDNCLIYVKGQTEKDWVLAQNSDFTNVQIKSVGGGEEQ